MSIVKAREEVIASNVENMKCINCGSIAVEPYSEIRSDKMYWCFDCGLTFPYGLIKQYMLMLKIKLFKNRVIKFKKGLIRK